MWYDKLMVWLLRSPLHRLLSKNTALITVTGRKSGREYTTPVNYVREGDTLWIISKRDRTWWRNLRGGAPVRLRLAGHDVTADAELLTDAEAVAANLPAYLRHMPMSARALGVSHQNGSPDPAELAAAAHNWLMVRARLRELSPATENQVFATT